MGMEKKQIAILSGVAALVVVVVVAGILARDRGGFGGIFGGDSVDEPGGGAPGPAELPVFTPEVPVDAVPTPAKTEAPASTNPDLTTKILGFDLRASRGGFSPASLIVNRGDTLVVDFAATDGDYDFDIPYLGAYFSVVREGATKKLPFDTSLPGTFIFQCRDHCPPGGVIRGELIVLP